MSIIAFTSFSFSYLNRARVLGQSLKRLHPDWQFWAVLTDKCPEGLSVDWASEPFDKVVYFEDLIGEEAQNWIFGHSVVEACTAVKGAAAARILEQDDCSGMVYLDPDIAVINSLQPVVDLLEHYSVVLTPHQTRPCDRDNAQSILDNEVCSLAHGSYNLGFLALAQCDEAHAFCKWWDDRLRDWCHDRKDIGIFVDQKWCDLVPCFFDDVKILRDPGYNVASWNLDYRKMSFDENGVATINGVPLRFYHFTKLGPVGDAMTNRYAGKNYEIQELWAWYRREVDAATEDGVPDRYWHYGTFDNGVEIPQEARRMYRERSDLRAAFKDPFSVEDGYFGWLNSQTDIFETERSA